MKTKPNVQAKTLTMWCNGDGTPLIVVQGARYELAVGAETYTLAVCHALERTLALDVAGKVRRDYN